MLSHGWFLQMIKPDVLVVLFDPGLNGMSYLSNVDLPTLAGDAVNTQCFHAKVIIDGLKETGDPPRWEAYSFYVISW
jgi:hypothetical protein